MLGWTHPCYPCLGVASIHHPAVVLPKFTKTQLLRNAKITAVMQGVEDIILVLASAHPCPMDAASYLALQAWTGGALVKGPCGVFVKEQVRLW